MTITFALRALNLDDGGNIVGKWVAEYDPEWTPDGYDGPQCGMVVLSDEVADAMQFDSFLAALHTWQVQSVTKPLRPDGKPNRPLTAHTIEVVQLVDGVEVEVERP